MTDSGAPVGAALGAEQREMKEARRATELIMAELGLVPQMAPFDGRDKALPPEQITRVAEIIAKHALSLTAPLEARVRVLEKEKRELEYLLHNIEEGQREGQP